MTQEEKQLLLRDLCARLPYETKAFFSVVIDNPVSVNVTLLGCLESIPLDQDEIYIKSFLRPMSSMTEDEREEIEVFIFNEWYQEDSCKIDKEGWIEILANYDVSGIDPCFCSDYVDWLNAHHFDYRGLIPMGLALEASKDMYKIK